MNSTEYYNKNAETYSNKRSAVDWILNPLIEISEQFSAKNLILEIGCGTGNYIIGLSEVLSGRICQGFDASAEMLEKAKSRKSTVQFKLGNADEHFPFESNSISLAFSVDVIHHIKKHKTFFIEAERVLLPGGLLIIVTDSEEDLSNRSITTFFPETLHSELNRYPKLGYLKECAIQANIFLKNSRPIQIDRDFSQDLMGILLSKSFSCLSLITEEQYANGLKRSRDAMKSGKKWHSCSTILTFSKRASKTLEKESSEKQSHLRT